MFDAYDNFVWPVQGHTQPCVVCSGVHFRLALSGCSVVRFGVEFCIYIALFLYQKYTTRVCRVYKLDDVCTIDPYGAKKVSL